MSTAIDVRQLKGIDAELASRTIRAIKRGRESSEPPSLDSDGMRLWLESSSNVLIAATEAARPVGLALGYLLDRVDEARSMLFFYEIVVTSDYRRRGIGRRLVEAMKTVAREQQVSKMWVQTDPGNTAARALYQHTGSVKCASVDLLYVWTDQTLDTAKDRSP